MWGKPRPLRPHHGLCMAFFQGEGYNEGFTAVLAARLSELEGSTEPVALTVGLDVVCAPCPHSAGGVCDAAEKVEAYDRAVLRLCGLEEGEVLPFLRFVQLAQRQIIAPGRRREVCRGCQWDGLCAKTKSRWEGL